MSTHLSQESPTAWDLADLYASDTDPAIERDMREIEAETAAFKKKWYKRASGPLSAKQLVTSLREYEALYKILRDPKPLLYYWLRTKIDGNNETARSKLVQYQQRCTAVFNDITFYELMLGRTSRAQLKELAHTAGGKQYSWHVRMLMDEAKHRLTEAEERIMSLKSLPANSMWVEGLDRATSALTLQYKGETVPLAQAQGMVSGLPVTGRRQLHGKIMDALEPLIPFAEQELNAVVIDRKINDELRGFTKPYSATTLSYLNTDAEVESLVQAVTNDFSTSHSFYKLKAALLKQDRLTYADRAAPFRSIGRTFSYSECVELLREALGNADDRFLRIFDAMVENGRIDVYPRVGKTGGAFQISGLTMPSHVLLNHTNSIRDAFTFSHEVGHAIHSEMSRAAQGPLYQDYPFSSAECASTLFEGIFERTLVRELSTRDRITLLHDRLQDMIAMTHRQIAFFNFELELHMTIREHGAASADEIKAMLNRHMEAYLGPTVALDPQDGNFFILVGHFRRYFYVYSYVYGSILSGTMLRKLDADPGYMQHIVTFLESGRTALPETIFRSIGIDTRDPAVFTEGLKRIAQSVQELDKLARRQKLIA